jgi:hypothetical protein
MTTPSSEDSRRLPQTPLSARATVATQTEPQQRTYTRSVVSKNDYYTSTTLTYPYLEQCLMLNPQDDLF